MKEKKIMDAKGVLDSVLADGQSMASGALEQAMEKAEQHLDMPEAGPERDAMISGMKTGAVILWKKLLCRSAVWFC